ncbi:hypothetical protein H0H93_005744 [Arthromyces matolae]|nr:hypothetical protein H0H93_005744 [Arthromyces matolae]
MTKELPPELWKKTFDFLNPADLRASTLTCSSFRWLAQPLLFSVFDLSPFFLAPNTDQPRMFRPRKYLDRTLERLQFYRSPHIAPAVYHCWISPYSRWGFPPRHPRDYLDPELIIDNVIEALPFFPNLRILSWHCIDFSATWWDVIRRLPLRKLWINSCTVLASEPMRPPMVTHLDLDHWAWEGETTNHPSVHEGHLSGVSQDMMSSVLHPDCTQHISVPRVDTATRLLSLMTTFNDPFTYLQTLRIPFQVISSPYFTQVLINAPLLKELRIFPPEEDLFQTSESPPLLLPSTSLQFLTTCVRVGPRQTAQLLSFFTSSARVAPIFIFQHVVGFTNSCFRRDSGTHKNAFNPIFAPNTVYNV